MDGGRRKEGIFIGGVVALDWKRIRSPLYLLYTAGCVLDRFWGTHYDSYSDRDGDVRVGEE